jgi:hypothetical protein
MDALREFWAELPDRWDDPYFWADHLILQVAAVMILWYALSLVLCIPHLLLRRALAP